MPKRKSKPVPAPEVCIEFAEEDGKRVVYVVFQGERIAKRYSDERWIILQPGYWVWGSQPGDPPDELWIEWLPQ
jgi:hypothetical protein